jgi:hypothetical protein
MTNVIQLERVHKQALDTKKFAVYKRRLTKLEAEKKRLQQLVRENEQELH